MISLLYFLTAFDAEDMENPFTGQLAMPIEDMLASFANVLNALCPAWNREEDVASGVGASLAYVHGRTDVIRLMTGANASTSARALAKAAKLHREHGGVVADDDDDDDDVASAERGEAPPPEQRGSIGRRSLLAAPQPGPVDAGESRAPVAVSLA